MDVLEKCYQLSDAIDETHWVSLLERLIQELGYDNFLFAVAAEGKNGVGSAIIRSSYAYDWRRTYDDNNMAFIDPTVEHCLEKVSPLIWRPEIFVTQAQQEMYEEARAFGLRTGISLPIHGPDGVKGMLCVVNDNDPRSRKAIRENLKNIAGLALLRDFLLDTGKQFFHVTNRPVDVGPSLTPRESEVLKWLVAGKSSWEMSKIFHCSEANIEFHVKNLRNKFQVQTRRQVVVRAIALGIIPPI